MTHYLDQFFEPDLRWCSRGRDQWVESKGTYVPADSKNEHVIETFKAKYVPVISLPIKDQERFIMLNKPLKY